MMIVLTLNNHSDGNILAVCSTLGDSDDDDDDDDNDDEDSYVYMSVMNK